MCMSAFARLAHGSTHNVSSVVSLWVGTESLVDRSKSIKSFLMPFFTKRGLHSLEGVDCYNACYGGTAALLSVLNEVDALDDDSDGALGVAICADVADMPRSSKFMTGAAAVAMLVGTDAPLALMDHRITRVLDEWDFYKPVGWPSMAPIMDGPGSMLVYFDCLAACQSELAARGGGVLAATRGRR